MSTALHYIVYDSANPEESKELIQLLEKKRFSKASKLNECNLLIVHNNTDTPGKAESKVTKAGVDALIRRGGVYVRYTSGADAWTVSGESEFYGSLDDLKNRIAMLVPPISITSVLDVFRTSGGGLVHALAILCQAFLAAYVQSLDHPIADEPEPIRDALLKADIVLSKPIRVRPGLPSIDLERRRRVMDREWWRTVLRPIAGAAEADPPGSARRLVEVLMADWRAAGGKPPPEGGDRWRAIEALAMMIWGDQASGLLRATPAGQNKEVHDTRHKGVGQVVAEAYLAIASLPHLA